MPRIKRRFIPTMTKKNLTLFSSDFRLQQKDIKYIKVVMKKKVCHVVFLQHHGVHSILATYFSDILDVFTTFTYWKINYHKKPQVLNVLIKHTVAYNVYSFRIHLEFHLCQCYENKDSCYCSCKRKIPEISWHFKEIPDILTTFLKLLIIPDFPVISRHTGQPAAVNFDRSKYLIVIAILMHSD